MPAGRSFFSPSFSFSRTFCSVKGQSRSAHATKFSVCARGSALSFPIPPNPTTAKLIVSLGAWNPTPPRTWRGTIITPRPIFPVSATNRRRVSFLGAIATTLRFSLGSSVLEGTEVVVARANGFERTGRVVVLDEIMPDPAFVTFGENASEVDRAGADFRHHVVGGAPRILDVNQREALA